MLSEKKIIIYFFLAVIFLSSCRGNGDFIESESRVEKHSSETAQDLPEKTTKFTDESESTFNGNNEEAFSESESLKDESVQPGGSVSESSPFHDWNPPQESTTPAPDDTTPISFPGDRTPEEHKTDTPEQDFESKKLVIDNKYDLVGIFYLIWHDPVAKQNFRYNSTEILEEAGRNREDPRWGPLHLFHYWEEPALGYYKSSDPEIIRTHMKQLSEAGIDIIYVDNTNANSDWPEHYYNEIFGYPSEVLLDTMLEMRNEGLDTPHVVFWNGSWSHTADPAFAVRDTYERLVSNKKYGELFVFYEGKPMMLVTQEIPADFVDKLTIRLCWGLQQRLREKEWSFLQVTPQNVTMNSGQAEAISISVAVQETYITNFDTALPQRGGITYADQWKRAFEVRPKLIFITGWNEWIAQRFEDEHGNTRFVDAFTHDYNRDIEPSKSGYKDSFYNWTKEYIRAYKAHEPFPEGLTADTVTIGDFEIGDEGWYAGSNTAKTQIVFEDKEKGYIIPANGYRMLKAEISEPVSSAFAIVQKDFKNNVSLRDHRKIKFSVFAGNTPGDTFSGEVKVRLTLENEIIIEDTFYISEHSGWKEITFSVDNASDSYPRAKLLEIGFRDNTNKSLFFYIDNIRIKK